ncbi:MAG: S1C family serine protease [Phycisphaerae bacterium]
MRRLLSIPAIFFSLAVAASLHADEDMPAAALPSQGANALEQLSSGTVSLYRKISPSLVRVRIDQGFQSMLTQQQRREFNEWLKAQSSESPSAQPDAGDPPPSHREQRRAARAEKMGTATQPANLSATARPMLNLFRRFLEQKLKTADATPQEIYRWKYIQNRVQQPIQETTGIILDDQGDVLVLGNWVKDGQPLSINVTLADGTDTRATYVGGHAARGFAIIKLDTAGPGPALPLASQAPAPGELLMCIAANSGAIGFIASPGPSQKRGNGEQRFPIYGNDERGPTVVINTRGELAALGSDRFALPLSYLKRDVQWILENRRDIVPRQLGVKYGPVPPALRKSAHLLANRPAIVVEDVTAGSLAEKAGLQKNDIVITIDHRPIIQLPQIQADMATETAPVPIGILRDNKELTLSMPLD